MTQANRQNSHERLYLDDLYVGQRFNSRTHVIDEAQIKAFARPFDPQPFHQDEDAAKDTLFAGLAASGWHTAAITMRLLVDSGLPLMGGIIGAGGELAWPKPTRPGDTLQVESEVLEITPSRSRPDRHVPARSQARQRQHLIGRSTEAIAASAPAACPICKDGAVPDHEVGFGRLFADRVVGYQCSSPRCHRPA